VTVAPRKRMGRATASAAMWAFLSTAGSKVVTLVGISLLARILAPAEFGLLAFAMAYMTYAESIGDLGSGMALVYWPDRRDDAAQITFVINLIAGIFWCLITLVLAPYVAEFFHAPQGTAIVRALALSFIIKFLGTTHDALAQKDLRFRARAIPEFGLAAVKAGVAIVLAYFGFGAWSLVWGHIAGLTVSTISLWLIVPWRPTWSFPSQLLKPMLGYGRGIIIVNVINAITSDADLTVVGRYIGITALGLYQMASKIPEAGVVVALYALSKVLFPAFAKIHAAGESLRTPFLRATRYVSALTVPASLGLFFLAKPIILAFFGPKWIEATPILRMLALFVGVGSLSNHVGNILKATGRAKLLAWLAVVKSLMIIPALIFAARFGPVAVATALLLVTTLTVSMTLVIGVRLVHSSIPEVLKALAPSFIAGGVMSAALWAYGLVSGALPSFVELFAGVALGGIVYLLTLWRLDAEIFELAKETLLARRAPVVNDPIPQAAP
jgi:O-antigen/teichoic acid export membrane protein